MINVRSSFNRRITELADSGVPVLTEPHQPWTDPCYRVEYLDAEVPRGSARFFRNVRVHVRGSLKADGSHAGTYDLEARARRLLRALGLTLPASVAVADLYDYATSPTAPAKVGTFQIERSLRGVSVISPPTDNPQVRHMVVNLVLVYSQRG